MEFEVSAKDLVTNALQEINRADNLEADPADLKLGYFHLQLLLDSWKAQLSTFPETARILFDAESGTQEYEIGVEQTWDAPRPTWIRAAGWVAADGEESGIEPLGVNQWQLIVRKTTRGTPENFYYDRGTRPGSRTILAGKLYLYPVPTTSGQVALYLPVSIHDFVNDRAGQAAKVTFPAGYADAIRLNLAVRLSRPFGKPVDRELKQAARDALGIIKDANEQQPDVLIPDQIFPAARVRRRGLRS